MSVLVWKILSGGTILNIHLLPWNWTENIHAAQTPKSTPVSCCLVRKKPLLKTTVFPRRKFTFSPISSLRFPWVSSNLLPECVFSVISPVSARNVEIWSLPFHMVDRRHPQHTNGRFDRKRESALRLHLRHLRIPLSYGISVYLFMHCMDVSVRRR